MKHLFTLDDAYEAGRDRFELADPVELGSDTRAVVREADDGTVSRGA